MFMKMCNRSLLPLIVAIAGCVPAAAQSGVGARASGMAGAFVAVADDASAVYWNPAGVATGAIVSALVDVGRARPGQSSLQAAANTWDTVGMAALSATAIGLAYYRLDTYGKASDQAAETGAPSREEVRRSVQATTSTVGVSLVQSVTEHLVVGATPKVMRSGGSTAFDVDAGAMVWVQRLRFGLVARNLTRPAFGRDGLGAFVLAREVRAGAAWGSGWTGLSRVIVSVDGDLTTRSSPSGDRRDMAAGIESWWSRQRIGVRGGVRSSTTGDARPAVAAGLSAGLKPGMLLEAHVVRGHADERSWGIGARMTF